MLAALPLVGTALAGGAAYGGDKLVRVVDEAGSLLRTTNHAVRYVAGSVSEQVNALGRNGSQLIQTANGQVQQLGQAGTSLLMNANGQVNLLSSEAVKTMGAAQHTLQGVNRSIADMLDRVGGGAAQLMQTARGQLVVLARSADGAIEEARELLVDVRTGVARLSNTTIAAVEELQLLGCQLLTNANQEMMLITRNVRGTIKQCGHLIRTAEGRLACVLCSADGTVLEVHQLVGDLRGHAQLLAMDASQGLQGAHGLIRRTDGRLQEVTAAALDIMGAAGLTIGELRGTQRLLASFAQDLTTHLNFILPRLHYDTHQVMIGLQQSTRWACLAIIAVLLYYLLHVWQMLQPMLLEPWLEPATINMIKGAVGSLVVVAAGTLLFRWRVNRQGCLESSAPLVLPPAAQEYHRKLQEEEDRREKERQEQQRRMAEAEQLHKQQQAERQRMIDEQKAREVELQAELERLQQAQAAIAQQRLADLEQQKREREQLQRDVQAQYDQLAQFNAQAHAARAGGQAALAAPAAPAPAEPAAATELHYYTPYLLRSSHGNYLQAGEAVEQRVRLVSREEATRWTLQPAQGERVVLCATGGSPLYLAAWAPHGGPVVLDSIRDCEKWELLKVKASNDTHRLKSYQGQYLNACNDSSVVLADRQQQRGHWQFVRA